MKITQACKIRIYIGLIVGFACTSAAHTPLNNPQQNPASSYSFIKTAKNVVKTPDADALQHFYLSLDSLSKGHRQKVNIVHIGDSHIQADIFSGKIRESFYKDTLIGSSGRGFVFPYSAVRTNNPVNIKVAYTGQWTGCRNVEKSKTCPWGLSGITATTTDSSATFTINPNISPEYTYPITRVKLFYDITDTTFFSVKLLEEEDRIIASHIDEKGFAQFDLKAPLGQITIGFERTDSSQTSFILQGVSLENDSKGLQYHSIGINGAEVTSVLRNVLEPQLALLTPDLVIISLGTNDAYMAEFDEKAFKENYGLLIQRIKKAAPNASLLLTTPGDCYRSRKYINYNNAKATKLIVNLAQETSSGVWNFYEIMGGLKSINLWYLNELASKDKIHLTRKGYILQGELLYQALYKDYKYYTHKHSKLSRKE